MGLRALRTWTPRGEMHRSKRETCHIPLGLHKWKCLCSSGCRGKSEYICMVWKKQEQSIFSFHDWTAEIIRCLRKTFKMLGIFIIPLCVWVGVYLHLYLVLTSQKRVLGHLGLESQTVVAALWTPGRTLSRLQLWGQFLNDLGLFMGSACYETLDSEYMVSFILLLLIYDF